MRHLNMLCTTMSENEVPHKKGQYLNDINIAKILELAKAGKSQQEIASLMHCTKNLIQNALANYDFDMFQGHGLRCELQRKTTKRENQYIERVLKQNFDVPLQDITNIITSNIFKQTLHRRRSEARLHSYIVAVKPGLHDVNVTAQLEWAMHYKDWTVEDWKKVIWSDESSIWVGANP